MTEKNSSQSRYARQWHYRPDEAISTSPAFKWPLNAIAVMRWIANRWLVIGENIVITVLAILTWLYFQPPLEQLKEFEFSWFSKMYLRNVVLISVVAGGLHILLYTKKVQGKKLKFDRREMTPNGRNFTFNNQIFDNLFWTLTSGVFFWTTYEALMLWAMANGYIPTLLWSENPIWFIALFFLTPIWISFHFYWAHRLLHWPPLYKLAHGLHHRNTNVGPWSGMSMHPIEHIIWLSGVLVHWVVSAHPVHILFHMQHQALTAATSHAGFESLIVKDRPAFSLGNFHHQLHHRYFECNYGNLEIPWDLVFGSFHDGTEESHHAFLDRRKRIAQNKP